MHGLCHLVNTALGRSVVCIIDYVGRSTAEWLNVLEGRCPHGLPSDTFDLTPNPDGKVRDIDIPILVVWNINVPTVDVVEFDLPEHSTFWVLT